MRSGGKYVSLSKALLLVSLSLDLTPLVAASSQKLEVKKVSLAGTGCAATPATGTAVVEDSGNSISVNFPSFSAKSAATSKSLGDMRRNCGMMFDLDYSKSQQFRVSRVELSGEAKGKELDGLVRIDFRFQGESTAIFQDLPIQGERANGKIEIKPGQTSWSRCGERHTFIAQLVARINKPPTAGEAELSVSGPMKLHLEWQDCKR